MGFNFAIAFESGHGRFNIGLYRLVKNLLFWASLLVLKILKNNFCLEHRRVLSV